MTNYVALISVEFLKPFFNIVTEHEQLTIGGRHRFKNRVQLFIAANDCTLYINIQCVL